MTLQETQAWCERSLQEMEELFVPEARLTLVMRHPSDPDCHFVITRDTDLKAVAALLAPPTTEAA